MKPELTKAYQLPAPVPEIRQIYFATIVGGAAILLMILAEMKFFGT